MPGRLADALVGVVTIVDVEFEAAQRHLDLSDHFPGSSYLVDDPAAPDLVLCQTPDRSHLPMMGTTNALIENFRPELIIVAGIAGGVEARGARPGDVVVPDYLHYGDFRKLSEAGEHRRYYAYDHPNVSIRTAHVDRIRRDPTWLERITVRRPGPGGPTVHVGDLVAGDTLFGDAHHREQRRMLDEFTSALAIDMESVGVARAVHEARDSAGYNPRFLVVRGISDSVGRVPTIDVPLVGEFELPRTPGFLGQLTGVVPSGVRRRVSGLIPEANDRQRGIWRPYAADAACAFAAEVVSSFLGRRVGP